MKKRLIITVVVVLCSVALLCAGGYGIWYFVNSGRIYEADGLQQNTRVYMKDVYCQDGKVYYTLVNDTPHELTTGEGPSAIERKENGEWKRHSPTGGFVEPRNYVMPFSHRTYSFPISGGTHLDDYLGDYRLIFHFKDFSAVGYLTITEELLPDYGFAGDLHYTDGIRQSTLLRFESLTYSNKMLQYTVSNHTGVDRHYYRSAFVQKKVDDTWVDCPDESWSTGSSFVLAHGDTYSDTDTRELSAGEYRVIFTDSIIYTDPETGLPYFMFRDTEDYLVGYLTVTEGMLS